MGLLFSPRIIGEKMAPVPDMNINLEQTNEPISNSAIDDNSIVISGMAGMFPMSNHIKGFSENLYNNVYMVSNKPRYQLNHPELHNYCGTIPDLEPFDAHFFGVHAKLSMCMDSMSRKLLEQSYQAIYDAGLSIDHVRESRVGVFIGSCFSETEKTCIYAVENRTGFAIMGCCKAMFANRISYWLDAKGPSMSLDAMCSSSIVALEHAVQAMRRGECDSAIVGSANICIHPQSSILYGRTIQLSPDGKAKSFDKNANGTVRSEAINVIYLQKAKDAKRIYAEISHVECKFIPEIKDLRGHLRSVKLMSNFFTEFYEQAKISPNKVEYIEGYGTAIPEVDKNELEAIAEVFCKDRSDPLLVGSVISNMGYSEAASGISSIIKVCLGYHTGKFAANINCKDPRDDVEALRDGRMRIVTDHTASQYSYSAINNFSIGGLNAHVLLKGHYNPKERQYKSTSLPYLVNMSGRHENAVKSIVNDLKSNPIDPEQIALLQNIHERNTSGHMARGYCIIAPDDNNETKVLSEKIEYYPDIKRPVWFVYSGMGSQWPTMGAKLMAIPIFASAIERCRIVLEPKGVDIVNILTNPDKTTFDNILNSFVGIAAVQIGLTDVLNELGIVPDKIIGHSVGELGCGYADGCLTAEEMILSAYSRGLVSVQTPFIHGSMAAVGLGYSSVSKICPAEIEVACHNSSESSTISGPSDVMKMFVDKLTAQGVFAKEVPCSNIAYHSRYIAAAGPKLKEYLSEVITDPKLRSDKWMSTSMPQEEWNLDAAKYSSAEYHTNNLLNPVLFEETARMIPQDAIAIEIAPHGLLQAILKRSLGVSCTNIPITRRGHEDPITFLLNAIGEMYIVGLNPKLQVLYPKIEYPISNGTGFLSHMPKWNHDEEWPLPLYKTGHVHVASQRTFVMSMYDDDHKYLEGNVKEGNIVFPLSAILVLVWETLEMSMDKPKKTISVQFNDVHCRKEANIYPDQLVRLVVAIQKGSGRFEVSRANNLLYDGYIQVIDNSPNNLWEDSLEEDIEYSLNLEDIYKILFRLGYFYKNAFRTINKASLDLSKAKIAWSNEWVTFIDSVFQIDMLNRAHDGVSKPKFIKNLIIDLIKHQEAVTCDVYGTGLEAMYEHLEKVSRCGGVYIKGIEYIYLQPCRGNNVLKRKEFMPYCQDSNTEFDTILHAVIQIVSENINTDVIKAVEINKYCDQYSVGDAIENIVKELVGINLDLTKISENNVLNNYNEIGHNDLIIGFNIIKNVLTTKSLERILGANTFILSIEDPHFLNKEYAYLSSYTIVAKASTSKGDVALLRLNAEHEKANVICLSVDNDCGLLTYTRDNMMPNDRLIITTKYPPIDDLKDLVAKWRKDNVRNKVHLYMSKSKLLSDEEFLEAANNRLAFNVFKDITGKPTRSISPEHNMGVCGSFFNLPIKQTAGKIPNMVLVNTEQKFDSFSWAEIPDTETEGVSVKVHYAGPTYYDTELAFGQIHTKNNGVSSSYGMDFSGTTQTGTRVMGLVLNGALGTNIRADPDLMWAVPEHWNLEDAATVPQPYIHAFYCLAIKGKIFRGSSILIHNGAGALGQAIISIALSLNCNVFTTVSSNEKKGFLLKLFPELKADQVGNSRNDTFETMIQYGTNGRGCNAVISGLKGYLREVSMKCVGFGGSYVDISYKDANNNSPFGIFYLSRQRSYLPAKLSTIFDDLQDKKLLQGMICEGISRGYVRPLSRVTYSPNEVQRAFQLLSSSCHRGRVLLRMQELSDIKPKPSISCQSDKTHIIICRNQEYGIDVANKLVELGARKLLINCDPILDTGFLNYFKKSWINIGVKIEIIKIVLNESNIHSIINKATEMGPIEGIFIIDLNNKTLTQHLDKVTRELRPKLKYFVMCRTTPEGFNSDEIDILDKRAKMNIPSFFIHYPTLNKYGFDSCPKKAVPQSIHDALQMLEVVLGTDGSLSICSYSIEDNNVDVLLDIAAIAGININENMAVNTRLIDLGIEEEQCDIINNYLEKITHTILSREEIFELTIGADTPVADMGKDEHGVLIYPYSGPMPHPREERLQDVGRRKPIGSQNATSEKVDLATYFTYIDPEEIDGSVDMKIVPSIVPRNAQRYDAICSDETYLVIIPDLEGHYGMFVNLCERLKVPAVILLPLLECYQDSIEQQAERYVKLMNKKMDISNKRFHILGYSYGTLVAMEMTKILEDRGYEGVLYCLDSSPDVFPQQLLRVIGSITEPQLQDAVIEQMFSLMAQEKDESLTADLRGAYKWEEKVEVCIRHLSGRVPYSSQYAKFNIEAAYGRICAGRQYSPKKLLDRPLNSQIVLLRGKVPEELSELPYDFGLSHYSTKKPFVYQLEAYHRSAPQDLHCSNIINRHLSSELLERFQVRNLCDVYTLDANNTIY